MSKNYVIAFADIAGSTALYESVGDIRAKTLITGLQRRIAEVIAEGGGQVQEIVGDEIMFHFDDVNACATCVCDIQETTQQYSSDVGEKLSVRIGLHDGPVLMESGRMFGDTINAAARVTAIAQGGQIILSESVASRLTGPQSAKARRFDEVCVKGKREEIVVYDLLWKPFNVTAIAPVSGYDRNEIARFTLRYLDGTYALDHAKGAFVIGRDPDSDLIVDVESVSRKHVSIDFQRNRFVLSDTSTNGTYIYPEGGESLYLRRQSIPLWGRGEFALGVRITAGCKCIIHYSYD